MAKTLFVGSEKFSKEQNYRRESQAWFFTSLQSLLCQNTIGEVPWPSTQWNLLYLNSLVVWGGVFWFVSLFFQRVCMDSWFGVLSCICEGKVSSF